VLGRVGDRLGGAEVQSRLDLGRQTILKTVGHDHRNCCARSERADGGADAVVGQQGGMDAVREVTQVAQSALQVLARAVQQGGGRVRVVEQACLGAAEGHQRADEGLLCAVVQVALEPAAGVVTGHDDPLARLCELARDRGLGLGAPRSLLEAPPRRDVEDDPVEPLALMTLDDAAPLQHPAVLTCSGHDAVLDLEVAAALDRFTHRMLDVRAVVRVDHRSIGAATVADEVLGGIARDALDLVTDEMHRPARVDRAAVDRPGDVARERHEQRGGIRRSQDLRHPARR
jgi:hypothetical protein